MVDHGSEPGDLVVLEILQDTVSTLLDALENHGVGRILLDLLLEATEQVVDLNPRVDPLPP